MMRVVTVYINQGNLAEPVENPVSDVRCINCGRLLAKIRGRVMALINANSPYPTDIPVGVDYIQHQCHSCKTMFNILFQ